MNINDEELQKRIEQGSLSEANDVDIRAYREVFKALAAEPTSGLPMNFVDKVVSRIAVKKQKTEARDYFWLGVGLVLLLIMFVVAFVLTAPNLHLGFLKDMSGYSGLLVLAIAMLIGFNWLDKRILHKNAEPNL